MTDAIDTSSEAHRLACLERYKARVDRLKRCKSQAERLEVFKQIEEEVNIHEARTCWMAAFPKKDGKGNQKR